MRYRFYQHQFSFKLKISLLAGHKFAKPQPANKNPD